MHYLLKDLCLPAIIKVFPKIKQGGSSRKGNHAAKS
jgi:hypothetical protein